MFAYPLSRWFAAPILLLPLLFVGCANPGLPRPPSLHLPEKAAKLQVKRVGSRVEIGWTTPAETTDGGAIRAPVTARVCRIAASAAGRAAACQPIARLAVTPGPATASDPLPPALTTGPAALLEYTVELDNEKGRSAGPSDPAFTASGEAPAAVTSLIATSRPRGIQLTWDKAGLDGSQMELRRTLTSPPRAPAKTRAPAPVARGRNPPKGSQQQQGTTLLVAQATQGVAESSSKPDPGGILDTKVQDGEAFLYVAQRTRMVTLDSHAIELRGLPSSQVAITYRDTFPPAQPTDLVTVAGGGFGTALSIDLSWDAASENDLRGYNVYRREPDGVEVKLTASPVLIPAFRDLQIVAGHSYTYRVTALDSHGNESAFSKPATETLPK